MTALAGHAPLVLDTNDHRVFARREEVAVLTVSIDPEGPLEGSGALFAQAAQSLATELATKVWVLTAGGSGAQSLTARAFGARGQQRWSLDTSEDAEPQRKKALTAVSRAFGEEAIAPTQLKRWLPYWRLWADVSKQPEQVVAFDSEALLALRSGWRTEPFELDARTRESLAAAAKARRKRVDERLALPAQTLKLIEQRAEEVRREHPAPAADSRPTLERLRALLGSAAEPKPGVSRRERVEQHPLAVELLSKCRAKKTVSSHERARVAERLSQSKELSLTYQQALSELSFVLRAAGIYVEQ